MQSEIISQLRAHQATITMIESTLIDRIVEAVQLLAEAFNGGKKVLIMGNGGSAGDAQHFAAEIVGRFKMERRGLPAISLTTDTSIITAIGNDYGFDTVFRRQVEALATEGDVVIGISTSGSSPNVHAALTLARETGCRTIALLGRDGGTIRALADVDLTVPCHDTPRIQEGHITIIHIICDLLEKRLFS